MTKEDWKQIEQIVNKGGSVDIRIGDDVITIKLGRMKLKLVYTIFVNGEIKGEWFTKDGDCGIAERYYCKKQMNMYNNYKDIIKVLGKRRAKKEGFLDKFEFYVPSFSSFRTLKSQYISRHKNIELVEEYGHRATENTER
jgi:hypothetical protein